MSQPGTSWSPRNWGAACAVLTASAVTLIGIVIGLEPETILLRTTVSGAAVGIVVSLTARFCHSVAHPNHHNR
jgi:hypothetical protein